MTLDNGSDKWYFIFIVLQSESNVQKIIVSNPAIGSHSYGLTDLGKEQARKVLQYSTQNTLLYRHFNMRVRVVTKILCLGAK